MRYRLMASYLGASYQAAVGPTDRDVTLFAAPPPPEEHGFSPAPGGIWRKRVRLDDLDGLWESRPIGSYHGEPCLVLDDLGDRLHIVYLGMDERRAAQLGYWEVDRGVFEVVIPRHDVSDLAEERHEFPVALLLSALPRALGAGDPVAGGPGMSQNGAGAARGVPGGNALPVPTGRAIGALGPGGGAGVAQPSVGVGTGLGAQGAGAVPGWNGAAGPVGPAQPGRGQFAPGGPAQLPAAMQLPPGVGLQQSVTGAYQAGVQNGMSQNSMPGMPGVPGMPTPPGVPGLPQRPDAAQFPGGQQAAGGQQVPTMGPGLGAPPNAQPSAIGGAPLPYPTTQVPARPQLPAAQLPAAQQPAVQPAGVQPPGMQPARMQQFLPVPPLSAAPRATGAPQAGAQQGAPQQPMQQPVQQPVQQSVQPPTQLPIGPQAANPQASGPQVSGPQATIGQAPAPRAPQAPAPTAVAAWHGSPGDGNGNWYYQPGSDPQQNGMAANGYAANGMTLNGYGQPGQGTGSATSPDGLSATQQVGGVQQGGVQQGGVQRVGMQQYAQPAQPAPASGYQQAPPVGPAPQPQFGQPAQPSQAVQPPSAQGPALGQPLVQPTPQAGMPIAGMPMSQAPGAAPAATQPPQPLASQALASQALASQALAGPSAPSGTGPMPVPAAAVAQPMAQQSPVVEPSAQQPVTQPLSAPLAAAAPLSHAPAVAPSEAGSAGTTDPFTTVPAAPNPDQLTSQPQPAAGGALSKLTGAVRGRRAARKPRLAMSAIFADLVDMADIPRSAYAVDEEITGAMCLFKTDGGYEVFSCAEDARHEVRFFEEEEAAYFYLFGVLAAEALRNGRLSPRRN